MAELIDVSWEFNDPEPTVCYGNDRGVFSAGELPARATVTLTVQLIGMAEIRDFLQAVHRFFGVSRQGKTWGESYRQAERQHTTAPKLLGGRHGR